MENLYRIGAVAKRTGVSPECLRAWERRYGLEPAERAGKTRFYSEAQVERLTAIKSLIDQGHPISALVHLPDAELEHRLRTAPRVPRAAGDERVGLVGGPLIQAHRDAGDATLQVVGEWASIGELRTERQALPPLDCVIVYVPTLDPKRIDSVVAVFPSAHVVVTFKYATAADLAHFRANATPLRRWPTDWESLERLATAGLSAKRGQARQFSDEQLLHIGLMAAHADCECPRHLAELIAGLNDYAHHVPRCAAGEDHAAIADEVQTARTRLEDALAVLVQRHRLLATAN